MATPYLIGPHKLRIDPDSGIYLQASHMPWSTVQRAWMGPANADGRAMLCVRVKGELGVRNYLIANDDPETLLELQHQLGDRGWGDPEAAPIGAPFSFRPSDEKGEPDRDFLQVVASWPSLGTQYGRRWYIGAALASFMAGIAFAGFFSATLAGMLAAYPGMPELLRGLIQGGMTYIWPVMSLFPPIAVGVDAWKTGYVYRLSSFHYGGRVLMDATHLRWPGGEVEWRKLKGARWERDTLVLTLTDHTEERWYNVHVHREEDRAWLDKHLRERGGDWHGEDALAREEVMRDEAANLKGRMSEPEGQ